MKPFKGIVYNSAKVKSIPSVVTPPYDVISPRMQDELYKRSPHNFIRLELGRIMTTDDSLDNRYTRAGALFGSWLKDGILKRDGREALYIYAQGYKDRARVVNRLGFLGLMGFGAGEGRVVLPHENTLRAPKADRLSLMREVKANLSPIFVLFDDKSGSVTPLLKRYISRHKPFIDMPWDGERHLLWRLDDPAGIKKITSKMRSAKLFIADGHHRFETAKNFSRELNGSSAPQGLKERARSLMVYFVESDEKMLTILPAHRLVRDAGGLDADRIIEKLSKFFFIEKAPSLKAMMERLALQASRHVFGMCAAKGEYRILRLKRMAQSDRAIKGKPLAWKRLDVSILHKFIFQRILGIRDTDDNIEFVKDPKEAAALIGKGSFTVAFFLNSTKVSQVKAIAKLGERMPRKATYFYPKPLSGLVINKFD